MREPIAPLIALYELEGTNTVDYFQALIKISVEHQPVSSLFIAPREFRA